MGPILIVTQVYNIIYINCFTVFYPIVVEITGYEIQEVILLIAEWIGAILEVF